MRGWKKGEALGPLTIVSVGGALRVRKASTPQIIAVADGPAEDGAPHLGTLTPLVWICHGCLWRTLTTGC